MGGSTVNADAYCLKHMQKAEISQKSCLAVNVESMQLPVKREVEEPELPKQEPTHAKPSGEVWSVVQVKRDGAASESECEDASGQLLNNNYY